VDYYIPVVEKDPSRIWGALLMQGENVLFLQSPGDRIDDSPDLRCAFPRTDNEVVRKITNAPGIQQDYIRGLLVADDIDNFMGQF